MGESAVFLDRDGTINIDYGYVSKAEQVELFPQTGEALSFLKNQLGLKLIVISNQSGIARGMMTHEDVALVNKRIDELLKVYNVKIDDYFYCPYHPEFDNSELCKCRKPSPLMIYKAAEKHKINIKTSYLIGDMISDIECGKSAGVKKNIFVKTSKHKEYDKLVKRNDIVCDYIAENLPEAVNFIKRDLEGGN